jgi:hypothetical protein
MPGLGLFAARTPPTVGHPMLLPSCRPTPSQLCPHRHPIIRLQPLAATQTDDRLSEEYTDTMQKRMGSATLTYCHEDGMNYNRIMEDIIVGSCLQTPTDLDGLVEQEGVSTILCLQEDSDMAYFSLDVSPIRQRALARGDVRHLRHAIRDFDPFSLRRRLPGAVALLARAAASYNGTSYIHCTAGLGRAPAAALAYMWWCKDIPLDEAYALLTGIRPCKPKADAIRAAAVDLLYGADPVPVTLTLMHRGTAQKVEIAGLDVGWGQFIRLVPHPVTGKLSFTRRLPPGTYQFKFIYDGDIWGPSMDHMTVVDGGNLNNLLIVPDPDLGPEAEAARARIRAPGGELTSEEKNRIKNALKDMKDVDGESFSAPCEGGPL